MKNSIASVVGLLLLLAGTGPARAGQGVLCDGIGGTSLESVIVPAGATCDLGLGDDIIFGDVTLEAGATLTKLSGPLTIMGDIRGTDIEALNIGGCTVMGGIDIDGATGDVFIAACSIHAGVTVRGVSGSLTIHASEIGQRLRVIGNLGGPGAFLEIASNVVSEDVVVDDNEHSFAANIDSNKLGGRLTCRNNIPAPSSAGSDGTIALKGQDGQCADLP